MSKNSNYIRRMQTREMSAPAGISPRKPLQLTEHAFKQPKIWLYIPPSQLFAHNTSIIIILYTRTRMHSWIGDSARLPRSLTCCFLPHFVLIRLHQHRGVWKPTEPYSGKREIFSSISITYL